MLLFALILLVIECLITFYAMRLFVQVILGLPGGLIKMLLLRLNVSPAGGFFINLWVSSVMAWFTGAGLSSGFANLGASIIVGFIMPIYFKRVYKLDEVFEQVKTQGILGFINRKELKRMKASRD